MELHTNSLFSKLKAGLLLLKTFLIYCVGLSFLLNVVVAFASADDDNDIIDLDGVSIEFLTRTYDAGENRTKFVYKIKRGLLSSLVSKIELGLPSEGEETPLSAVTTGLTYTLGFLEDWSADVLSLSCTPLSPLVSELELEYLGDIEAGEITAKILDTLTSDVVEGIITGPILPEIPDTGDDDFPECIFNSALPPTLKLGEEIEIQLEAAHSAGEAISVLYNDLVDGATLSVPAGEIVDAATDLLFTFKPTEPGEQTFHINLLDLDGDNALCILNFDVLDNEEPISAIEPVENPITCRGLVTHVSLDGSASYDPEGESLTYAWTHNCAGATIENSDAALAVLSLTKPGEGIANNCTVELTVSDGVHSTTEDLEVHATACDNACPDNQKDQCGVCNGANLCVDCEGTLFGKNFEDRCGVCGGTNSCVDCNGELNGGAIRDLCGICGGDSSSCRNCQPTNYEKVQSNLNTFAAKLEKTGLAHIAYLTKRFKLGKKKIKRLEKLKSTIQYLRQANWQNTWSLSSKNLSCVHYLGCESTSHSETLNDYKTNADELKKAVLQTIRMNIRTRFAPGQRKGARLNKLKKRLRRVRRDFRNSVAQATSYPSTTVSCN